MPAGPLLVPGVLRRRVGRQASATLGVIVGWSEGDAIPPKEALPRAVGVLDDELARPVYHEQLVEDRHR
jgi:hypothetical protein